MSELSLEIILLQAAEEETRYDWSKATASYEKALSLLSEQGVSERAHVHERLGYAFYRAAMQADSTDEFSEKMREAITRYQDAEGLYGKLDDSGRTLRCRAMIPYLGYWLVQDIPEKKKLVEESWKLAEEALKVLAEAKQAREYGSTYDQLNNSARFAYELEWDHHARGKLARAIVAHGEQSIEFLSAVRDPEGLARAYTKTAVGLVFSYILLDLDERDKTARKVLEYWSKATELSEDSALTALTETGQCLSLGPDKCLTNCEKALEPCRKTKDKFLVGSALFSLAEHGLGVAMEIEDPDERVKQTRKFLEAAEASVDQSGPVPRTIPLERFHADYYWELAAKETDLENRRNLLERALKAASAGLNQAEDMGNPDTNWSAHHILSKSLASLARFEKDSEEKKMLLRRALNHRNETISLIERLSPSSSSDRGTALNYLADIRCELASLDRDPETRTKILEEAASDKEAGLKLGLQYVQRAFERTGTVYWFTILGRWQFELGDLLNGLYELNGFQETLRRAAEAFEHASQLFHKSNLTSRMAECHWKAAQAYDALDDHLKAAESFIQASKNYHDAAEKIPQLKDFYLDYASYMQAWAEIEKAKYHHQRQEYGAAKEYYEKADALHEHTKKWNYLACNYYAWAQVENAEDLSRSEKPQESLTAFEEAAKSFEEGKSCLQAEQHRIQNLDEMQMVTRLIQAADRREEYCTARILLEEAKILDRRGDHYSSSEKYGLAAETFDKICQAAVSEQVRREMKHICTVAKAWQRMAQAEAEASPELYLEASKLFEEAKQLCPNENAKMITLGHSRFCRALEAGNRFSDSGDPALHATAIQHLESAAKYYVKAGFQNASEYAKATEILFNAYLKIGHAKKENDQEKKTKFYLMAEKLFEASAAAYAKAEQPARREQVLRLLGMVKEERELALSLTEVLHGPSILSATTALTMPTPTQEKAVGLERFAHADVQASLIVGRRTLNVGDDLDLEIELVNAGRGPAQLVKVEEMIPQGFEVSHRPEAYRVEDTYLNMKGKRLDALKTEELKLVLKPKVQGQFILKPRVLYLDEGGRYKSHEPEPVEITVKELGISGWLKGR